MASLPTCQIGHVPTANSLPRGPLHKDQAEGVLLCAHPAHPPSAHPSAESQRIDKQRLTNCVEMLALKRPRDSPASSCGSQPPECSPHRQAMLESPASKRTRAHAADDAMAPPSSSFSPSVDHGAHAPSAAPPRPQRQTPTRHAVSGGHTCFAAPPNACPPPRAAHSYLWCVALPAQAPARPSRSPI